jgi:hypothetical protein
MTNGHTQRSQDFPTVLNVPHRNLFSIPRRLFRISRILHLFCQIPIPQTTEAFRCSQARRVEIIILFAVVEERGHTVRFPIFSQFWSRCIETSAAHGLPVLVQM